MTSPHSSRRKLVFVGVLLIPRLIVLILALRHTAYCLQPDSQSYLTLAHQLWSAHTFSNPLAPFSPETYRVPGYPLFLAPFTAFSEPVSITLIACAQFILGLLTLFICWRWLNRISTGWAPMLGTLIFGCDLVALLHTPIVLSETLFLLVLTLAVAWTWNALTEEGEPRLFRSGILWGLTVLIRPVTLFLGPALSVLWWKNKKYVGIFFLSSCLLPFFWVLRNGGVAHFWGVSSQGGVDLLEYPAASVEVLRDHIPLETARAQLYTELNQQHPTGFPDAIAKDRAAFGLALSVIVRNPVQFLRYDLNGVAKILGGTGLEMLLNLMTPQQQQPGDADLHPTISGSGTLRLLRTHPRLIPVELGYGLMLMFSYFAFMGGVWKLWNAGERYRAIFITSGPIYILLLCSHIATYRLRLPMLPFLVGGVTVAFSNKEDLALHPTKIS